MEAAPQNSLFPLEAAALPFALPPHFEQFYRSHVRFVSGVRVRSSELHRRYVEWAKASGAPAVSLATQRDCMEAIGHRRITSNGVHYLDAAYAEAVPTIGDTLRLPLLVRPQREQRRDDRATVALLTKVDAALASLLDLRTAIVATRERVAPHIAARMALGLGDDR